MKYLGRTYIIGITIMFILYISIGFVSALLDNFILGLIIGGLVMTTLMCCLQINRINEYERLLIMRDKDNDDYEDEPEVVKCEVVE